MSASLSKPLLLNSLTTQLTAAGRFAETFGRHLTADTTTEGIANAYLVTTSPTGDIKICIALNTETGGG